MKPTLKVLLVDDHEPIVRYLAHLLRGTADQLLSASTGADALAIARREHPRVVVLDVCMPGMDGLEVCESIRRDPELADVRVVLMSALVGESGLVETHEDLGPDAYLAKPLAPEDVRRSVVSLLFEKPNEVAH